MSKKESEIERQIKELFKDQVVDYIFDQEQFVEADGKPMTVEVRYLFKMNKKYKCWWIKPVDLCGVPIVTFDKRKVYFLFRDKEMLTKEEREIIKQEDPYWWAKVFG